MKPVTKLELLISIEELKETLEYDPEIGTITWKKPPYNKLIGDSAIRINSEGKPFISINGGKFSVNRVAYALMKGEWPSSIVYNTSLDSTVCKWKDIYYTETPKPKKQALRLNRTKSISLKGLA